MEKPLQKALFIFPGCLSLFTALNFSRCLSEFAGPTSTRGLTETHDGQTGGQTD